MGTPALDPTPPIAAVICTRDRGARAAMPVAAIMNGTWQDFELLVVDQSTNDETAAALAPWMDDPRLTYLRTGTRGKTIALNMGIAATTAPLIAITDDDCEPLPDWLETYVRIASDCTPSAFFGPFVAHPRAAAQGYVPQWLPARDAVRTSTLRGPCLGGFGGNMLITRAAFDAVGGFNEELGRGGKYQSAEEPDFCLRLVLAGGSVRELTAPIVVHHGAVPWNDARNAMRGDYVATGRVIGWQLRRAKLGGFVQFALAIRRELGIAGRSLLRSGRPRGITRIWWLMNGAARGIVVAPPASWEASHSDSLD